MTVCRCASLSAFRDNVAVVSNSLALEASDHWRRYSFLETRFGYFLLLQSCTTSKDFVPGGSEAEKFRQEDAKR